MDDTPAIEAVGLTKRFGATTALAGLVVFARLSVRLYRRAAA